MGSLLGKPAKTPAAPAAGQVTSKDRATLDLKVARDKLKKYQKRLVKDSEKLMAQAKQLVAAGKKVRYNSTLILSFPFSNATATATAEPPLTPHLV
jgi:hypothetical protein